MPYYSYGLLRLRRLSRQQSVFPAADPGAAAVRLGPDPGVRQLPAVQPGVQPAPHHRRSGGGGGAPVPRRVRGAHPALPGEPYRPLRPPGQPIYLSEDVYGAATIAAVGVAAHEAGHAVQYAENYGPVRMRTAILPATRIGSSLSFILLLNRAGALQQSLFFVGHRAVLLHHPLPAGDAAGGVQRLRPGHRHAGRGGGCWTTTSCPARKRSCGRRR